MHEQTPYEKLMQRCGPVYYDMDTKPFKDHMEWARYNEAMYVSGERCLGDDIIGKYRVSTVYMGIDMGFMCSDPLIFETMIFCDEDKNDSLNMWLCRYTYKQEALMGHQIAIKIAKRGYDAME